VKSACSAQKLALGTKPATKKQRGVDWQISIDDARHKLKRLYPKIVV
jgi:hypothetical protein